MPTTPYSAIFAALSPEVQADIKAGAKSLRKGDAKRQAEYVSEKAAAEYIEVPVAHLRKTRLTGSLPGCLCKRIGRSNCYRIADLDAFMDLPLVQRQ